MDIEPLEYMQYTITKERSRQYKINKSKKNWNEATSFENKLVSNVAFFSSLSFILFSPSLISLLCKLFAPLIYEVRHQMNSQLRKSFINYLNIGLDESQDSMP